jgi:hypothetical protein
MDFTFWESKAVKLPKGPLYSSAIFLVGLGLLVLAGEWAGSLVGKKEVKFSGPTLPELQAWEKVVTAGDPTKLNEMLQKDGERIGTDMAKWKLVYLWKSDVLFDLYRTDLANNLKVQIDSLKAQMEAEKLKAQKEAAAAAGKTETAPGAAGAAPAESTKQ